MISFHCCQGKFKQTFIKIKQIKNRSTKSWIQQDPIFPLLLSIKNMTYLDRNTPKREQNDITGKKSFQYHLSFDTHKNVSLTDMKVYKSHLTSFV